MARGVPKSLSQKQKTHSDPQRGEKALSHSSLFDSGDGWVNNTINAVKGATESHGYTRILCYNDLWLLITLFQLLSTVLNIHSY